MKHDATLQPESEATKTQTVQSQEEGSKSADAKETEVLYEAQRIGSLTCIFVAFTLMIIERIVHGLTAGYYGFFLVVVSSCAGLLIYKAIKQKKKHEIVMAVLWVLFAIYAIVMTCISYLK